MRHFVLLLLHLDMVFLVELQFALHVWISFDILTLPDSCTLEQLDLDQFFGRGLLFTLTVLAQVV